MTTEHTGSHTGDPEWDRLLAEMDDARHILEHLTVDFFCEATENAAHYVSEAAKGMAHAAYLVAYAAEVVGWVGTALHWLGRIVPGISWVGDVVDRFGTVTEEKALKASFEALGLAAIGVEIAQLGWDARSTGHIAADAYRRIRQLAVEVEHTARGVLAILVD
jgi:hypothetical protein